MAKQRKSVFNTDLSKKEIQKEAKEVEKDALGDKGEQPQGRAALKNLYVDHEHHMRAKIGAAKRAMKLGEYIEYLIDQDAK